MILSLARPALLSIRASWKPFLLIQCCGVAIVWSYFHWASFRAAANQVAGLQTRWGLLFAVVTSAISGAVVPELARVVTGQLRFDRKRLSDLCFGIGLFAMMGIIGACFYAFLDKLWPTGGIITILKKVATDQFVYSPFLTLPFISFLCTLREKRWSILGAARVVSPAWYLNRVCPLLVLCWCFWIPMTSLMYAMPSKELVFCFAMCAQAAWGLLMMSVAASGRMPAPTPAPEEDGASLRAAA